MVLCLNFLLLRLLLTQTTSTMKRFFLILAIVAITVACSKENEQNEAIGANTKSMTDLESLYQTMISSQNYIEYKNARAIFIGKMNFTGIPSDVDTETKLKDWIRDNIAITDFADYATAVIEYDLLKERGLASLIENKLFFEEVQLLGGEGLADLLDHNVPQTEGCPQSCTASLNACYMWADAWYQGQVANASASWVSPDVGSTNNFNAQMIIIDTGYDLYNEDCFSEYTFCCAG